MMTFIPLPTNISTGRSQPEMANEAMQRGAFAVVPKPTGDRGKRFADVAGRLTFYSSRLAAIFKASGTCPCKPEAIQKALAVALTTQHRAQSAPLKSVEPDKLKDKQL